MPARTRDVSEAVSRILANKSRYVAVSQATGVPWWAIAIIHKMECNLSFEKHLHNGDRLTARTWRVPKGRPAKGKPPFTWEASAIDALQYDKLHLWRDWSVPGAAYCFEKFNGFGYRKYGIPSPYLWSFTNRYAQGKYVRDNVYDPNAVSEQSGAMALLYVLMQRDSSVVPTVLTAAPVVVNEDETLPAARDKALVESRTLYGSFVAFILGLFAWVFDGISWLAGGAKEVAGVIGEAANESSSIHTPIASGLELLGLNLPSLAAAIFIFGLVVAIGARLQAHATKQVG